jgi:hypothetical protein
MKKSLLVLFALLPLVIHAQTESFGNFKVAKQEIIYQKVFQQDSISAPLLESYYKTLPAVSNLSVKPEGIEFEINDIIVDYKKFGFSQGGTPSIIQTGKYSGKVSVGIKDGKYRVTFQSIQLTGDIGYKKITTKDNLTSYACKNSGTVLSQDWCRPNMLGLLDQVFTDKFQYKKVKDEW